MCWLLQPFHSIPPLSLASSVSLKHFGRETIETLMRSRTDFIFAQNTDEKLCTCNVMYVQRRWYNSQHGPMSNQRSSLSPISLNSIFSFSNNLLLLRLSRSNVPFEKFSKFRKSSILLQQPLLTWTQKFFARKSNDVSLRFRGRVFQVVVLRLQLSTSFQSTPFFTNKCAQLCLLACLGVVTNAMNDGNSWISSFARKSLALKNRKTKLFSHRSSSKGLFTPSQRLTPSPSLFSPSYDEVFHVK